MNLITVPNIPRRDEVDPVVDDGFAEPAVWPCEATSERVNLAGRSRVRTAGCRDERSAERERQIVIHPAARRHGSPTSFDVVPVRRMAETVQVRRSDRRWSVL